MIKFDKILGQIRETDELNNNVPPVTDVNDTYLAYYNQIYGGQAIGADETLIFDEDFRLNIVDLSKYCIKININNKYSPTASGILNEVIYFRLDFIFTHKTDGFSQAEVCTFGSPIFIADTGILFNNEGLPFNLEIFLGRNSNVLMIKVKSINGVEHVFFSGINCYNFIFNKVIINVKTLQDRTIKIGSSTCEAFVYKNNNPIIHWT